MQHGWAIDQFHALRHRRTTYTGYLHGSQPTILPAERIPVRFHELFYRYSYNLCPRVVATFTDRLQVDHFEVEDGPERASDVAGEVWRANSMDAREAEVYKDAYTSGDGFVMVWPDDNGDPRYWPHPAANVAVEFDDRTDSLKQVGKLWADPKVGLWRLTIYTAETIERFAAPIRKGEELPEAGSFHPFQSDDGEPEEANPYGRLPWFHFPNGPSGRLGRSVLEEVAPLQDQLNYLSLAMLYATGQAALPPRWVIGAEPQTDPETGRQEPPFRSDDPIWGLPAAQQGESRSFGQFDPADLRQFIELRDATIEDICRVTGVPVHHLRMESGSWPSGESRRMANGPMIRQVEQRQQIWGQTWADAQQFALEIAGQGAVRLSTSWVEAHEETAEAKLARVKQLTDIGVPLPVALKREAGWTQDQVDELVREQADAASAQGRALREAAMSGGDPAGLFD